MSSANSTGFKTVDTFTISFIYNIKNHGFLVERYTLFSYNLNLWCYMIHVELCFQGSF